MKNSLFLIKDFISKETLSGLILFVVTVLAVTIANSSFGSYYFELFSTQLGITFGQLNASMSLLHWINDVLMAIFFLVVGLEIKREMLIGELSSVKKASFPIIAAIGGMIVPAILYISLNPDHITGFGVPMATDIAFALGILMLLGNKVNPAIKLFLVTLAVVDDLGAIVVVAIFYTNELHFEYFLYAFAVYSVIWFLNYKNVQKLTPYIILGVFLWIFIHKTGIHSTIAGVLLAFAIPLNKKADLEESVEHLSVDNPLVKLEHALHNFSAFIIMPLFAFANAGVIIDFSNVIEHQLIVLGVALGLIIGKPIGIFSFTYLATKLKISVKPENVTWNDIFAVGFLGGIGFTMSIFISHLAFSDETIVGAVKLGIFASSVIAAIIGSVLLILKAKKVQS
ncbi:Na+/H+ antiporter NhaA [Aliarcobacter butzleri]|uniref:Na(+)/H(+) antiporter NhaA n=1 Tax=Aliarcobacter butzleri L351 TaxID=1447259 RepID=A0A837J3G1_9BACT|nr:Na+/H+ antiporter NhaA [Aliarcobacter butzleri]KLD99779.1 sodium:proton antiporter [Aliarcobacter butzleri L351]KLE11941.1 sodium:proton antiporter [Aliarcobacter butzleri L350]MCG3652581.1 Na+/H+ antiporter NhaA [Aliarcobacter butzleri]MCG3673016.1 Na+/H+ antiporter NhaA [Aliarcobacter butzleri]MDN5048113.1 Na+/H+ antiporter NhaA [Aliarcobacter butzleri]